MYASIDTEISRDETVTMAMSSHQSNTDMSPPPDVQQDSTVRKEHLPTIARALDRWLDADTEGKNLVVGELVEELLGGIDADQAGRGQLAKAISTILGTMGYPSKKKGIWNQHNVFQELKEADIVAKRPLAWEKHHPGAPLPEKWNDLAVHSTARSLAYADLSDEDAGAMMAIADLWNNSTLPPDIAEIGYFKNVGPYTSDYLIKLQRHLRTYAFVMWVHTNTDGKTWNIGSSDDLVVNHNQPTFLDYIGEENATMLWKWWDGYIQKHHEHPSDADKSNQEGVTSDGVAGKGKRKKEKVEFTFERYEDGYPILPNPSGIKVVRERQTLCREWLRAVLLHNMDFILPWVTVPWGTTSDKFSQSFTSESIFPPGTCRLNDPSKIGDTEVDSLLDLWYSKQQTKECYRPVNFSTELVEEKLGSKGRQKRDKKRALASIAPGTVQVATANPAKTKNPRYVALKKKKQEKIKARKQRQETTELDAHTEDGIASQASDVDMPAAIPTRPRADALRKQKLTAALAQKSPSLPQADTSEDADGVGDISQFDWMEDHHHADNGLPTPPNTTDQEEETDDESLQSGILPARPTKRRRIGSPDTDSGDEEVEALLTSNESEVSHDEDTDVEADDINFDDIDFEMMSRPSTRPSGCAPTSNWAPSQIKPTQNQPRIFTPPAQRPVHNVWPINLVM
ncbi:hypothetical protein CONPUDRAFT_78433 [Coniophora puteana RWD-64-598 SS2]|uniref:Uncharacterized protein n=1 Tax=Coniophora puteana (strain RWD-64-598) TaxID=741705 RepID=R7SDF4_CONPW|nr:uncharacterized protein CONPUDRAFT_78433 [Coniophora puteana RWD-64-598 SS2]EIW73905.1 hypothetical protein CONPUDRAFT_78433 [Coniophora puteana RWD-64-598 SS2]